MADGRSEAETLKLALGKIEAAHETEMEIFAEVSSGLHKGTFGPAADSASASAANDPNGKQQARQLCRDDRCEDAGLGGGE